MFTERLVRPPDFCAHQIFLYSVDQFVQYTGKLQVRVSLVFVRLDIWPGYQNGRVILVSARVEIWLGNYRAVLVFVRNNSWLGNYRAGLFFVRIYKWLGYYRAVLAFASKQDEQMAVV